MNFSTAFGKFPRAFFFFFRSKRSLVSVGYWKKTPENVDHFESSWAVGNEETFFSKP